MATMTVKDLQDGVEDLIGATSVTVVLTAISSHCSFRANELRADNKNQEAAIWLRRYREIAALVHDLGIPEDQKGEGGLAVLKASMSLMPFLEAVKRTTRVSAENEEGYAAIVNGMAADGLELLIGRLGDFMDYGLRPMYG